MAVSALPARRKCWLNVARQTVRLLLDCQKLLHADSFRLVIIILDGVRLGLATAQVGPWSEHTGTCHSVIPGDVPSNIHYWMVAMFGRLENMH